MRSLLVLDWLQCPRCRAQDYDLKVMTQLFIIMYFIIYVSVFLFQGMFRHEGVVILATSMLQTLSIDPEGMLHAMGKRTRTAQFRVHKVSSNIRMFESIAFPKKYIRMKSGNIDIAVSVRSNFTALYSFITCWIVWQKHRIYLCFLSFVNTEMVQVVDILPHGRQGPVYST